MFFAPKAKRQVYELKTPQASSLVEEAEAMPAESVRLERYGPLQTIKGSCPKSYFMT